MTPIRVPIHLFDTVGDTTDGTVWLEGLADTVHDLARRWGLALGPPYCEEASCSWVAPCTQADGHRAVLKIGFLHMEAMHEIDGLVFLSGDPTIMLFQSDRDVNAMLLECCEPGTTLRSVPEDEQDPIIAALLKRFWRAPVAPHPFRPLSEMINHWRDECLSDSDNWPDRVLVEEGLSVFRELCSEQSDAVLLATDLHAGNVLCARRQPWLVIDPKPFVGDPCYDATQHLLNCRERLRTDPKRTIRRLSSLLDVSERRVRDWTFARLATESGDRTTSQSLARNLSS